MAWTDSELAHALAGGEEAAQEHVSLVYRPRLIRAIPERWTVQFEGNPSPEEIVSEFLTRKVFNPEGRASFFKSFFKRKRKVYSFLLGCLRNFLRDKDRSAKRKGRSLSLDVVADQAGKALTPLEALVVAEPSPTGRPRTVRQACSRLLALIQRAKEKLSDKRYAILLLDARLIVAGQFAQEPNPGSLREEIEDLLPWDQAENSLEPVQDGPRLGEVWVTLIDTLEQGRIQEVKVADISSALGASAAAIHQWRRHGRRVLREVSPGAVEEVIPAWAYQGPRNPRRQRCKVCEEFLVDGTCAACVERGSKP